MNLMERWRRSGAIDNPLKAWSVIGTPALMGGMLLGAAAFLLVFGRVVFGIPAGASLGQRVVPAFVALLFMGLGYGLVAFGFYRAKKMGYLNALMKVHGHGKRRQ